MDNTEMMALADRTTYNSTPEDGFDCIYLCENGREVGHLNGPQNDPKVIARAEHWSRLAAGASAGAVKDLDRAALFEAGKALCEHTGLFVNGFDGAKSYTEAAREKWRSKAIAAAECVVRAYLNAALTPEPMKAGDEVMLREALASIAHAEAALSEHIEKYHDGDFEPHAEPEERASLRDIQHHLAGSLIGCDGEPISTASEPLYQRDRDMIADEAYEIGWCDGHDEALSTTAPQPDDGARGNQSDDDTEATFPAWTDEDEAYQLGRRDGYESAIQDIDIATGGDGELKASTIPGGTVDVLTMKQRIIARMPGPSVPAPAEPVAVTEIIKGLRHAASGRSDRLQQIAAIDAAIAFLYAHPPRVDIEAIARMIRERVWAQGDTQLVGVYAAARSIAAMIEGLPPHPIAPAAPVSVDEVAIHKTLIAAKCTTGDGTYVHAPTHEVISALRDALKMERK